MKSQIVRLSSVLCLVSLMFMLGPCVAAEGPLPTLRLDHIPAYGVSESILGTVLHGTPGLAVTGYLQVSEGGRIWGPKPTYVTPSMPVEEDGSFWLQFITGGDDIEAVTLYVLLIPADFVPGSSYDDTERVALDKLVVNRTPEGVVTILPREGRWVRPEPTPTPMPLPTPTATPLPTIVRFANPYAGEATISINYSPYTDNQNPKLNSKIPLVQLSRHLRVLRPHVDTLRTFGVSGELNKLYPLAEKYGYRVIAGAWLEASQSEAQIKAELDALIEVANRGWCDIAVVGSECLHRGDFTPQQMIGYIQYVKDRISDTNIPVTTSDTAGSLLADKGLGAACDVVLATYYPFFEGVSVEQAAGSLAATHGMLQAAFPTKEVIISETGWPSAGSAEGDALPSEANAARYFQEVYDWSEAEGIEVVYFSALDEGWKTEGSMGDIGTHWGHFTADGVLKNGLSRHLSPHAVA